jgi:hypothetical protein
LNNIKILWIADTSSQYIQNLLWHLKDKDTDHIIDIDVFDIFDTVSPGKNISKEILPLYGNVYRIKRHFPAFFYKNKYLRFILFNFFDAYLSFFQVLNFKYNLINIHFFTPLSFFLLPLYRIIASKTMITPWGSDVYRISNRFQKILARHTFKAVDYISVHPVKFKKDIKNILYLSERQVVDIEFGSRIIDVINELYNRQSKETIKDELGFSGKYIITCGYNGNPAHKHLEIISAFREIKTQITKNICLIFPFTYGFNADYYNRVQEELDSLGLCYRMYDSFLSDVDVAKLRIISDMFIHIQISDSYSATLQEYLLTDTKVINGAWLRYPDFEYSGIPYYLLDSIQRLPELIVQILDGDNSVIVSENLKNLIIHNGWNSRIYDWYAFYLLQGS